MDRPLLLSYAPHFKKFYFFMLLHKIEQKKRKESKKQMSTIRASCMGDPVPPILKTLLPPALTDFIRRLPSPYVEEIRLHGDRYAYVTAAGRCYRTDVMLTGREMNDLLLAMCGGSIYAYRQNLCQGFLTLSGGIRVGVCGSAAMENGALIGVGAITGLMIRIPQARNVSATELLHAFRAHPGRRGVLIYAPPGVGKTTLLRAVAREAASPAFGYRTVAVDTREEFCHTLEGADLNLDILVGYPREIGIEIAVRTMSADLIICDEIGSNADADAILRAANCGVPLIASAHASSIGELLSRPAFQMLHRARVFGLYAGIRRSAGGFSYSFSPWEAADNEIGGVRPQSIHEKGVTV